MVHARAAGTSPASTASRSAAPRPTSSSSRSSDTRGPTTRRRLRRNWRAPARCGRRRSRPRPWNDRARQGLGQHLHRAPAGGVAEVDGPPAQTVQHQTPLASRRAGARATARTTVASRWPTVTVEAATSSHSAMACDERDAERRAGQAGADQHDDEPLGPLGDADGGGQAGRLGPRADVAGQRPEHQAQQAPRNSATLVVAGEVPAERAEDRGVGHPVAGGVQHAAERRVVPPGPGHRAVDHVEQHEDHDEQRADEPPAVGKNTRAPATAATVPKTVMMLGVIPARARAVPSGVSTFGSRRGRGC